MQNKQKHYSIAIDGPAGAGKSTIAKLVAKELQFIYVDTGAMYRAMGLLTLKEGIDAGNEEAVGAYGKMASAVAKFKTVREKMVDIQKKIADSDHIIMDGRDIGTVVLPFADLKIYLTAEVGVRAERRFKELTEKGIYCNIEEIEKDIIARDYQDMNREVSPLRQAEDAVLLDCSYLSIEEVADAIIKLFREKSNC
jgi:cytidylate kinase